MNQKELIEKYKTINKIDNIDFSGASKYFKSAMKYYKNFQDGCANSVNFFDNTIALFNECSKPNRRPDYVSDSGSIYWYKKDGVIRGSDHWGNRVANCDWALKLKDGKTTYGTSAFTSKTFGEYKYGFVKWKDLLLKSELLELEGKEVLTTFENKVESDKVAVGKKRYQRKIIVTWEKV